MFVYHAECAQRLQVSLGPDGLSGTRIERMLSHWGFKTEPAQLPGPARSNHTGFTLTAGNEAHPIVVLVSREREQPPSNGAENRIDLFEQYFRIELAWTEARVSHPEGSAIPAMQFMLPPIVEAVWRAFLQKVSESSRESAQPRPPLPY